MKCDAACFKSESESVSHSVLSNSLRPQGLRSARLLCPWDSLGNNTGVGCHYLLEGIIPTQGSNLDLLHYRQVLYHLSHLRLLLKAQVPGGVKMAEE